jgi:hypothetical protein
MVSGMSTRQELGTITVAAGTSVNNRTTAVPFYLPAGLDSVIVTASGADCYANCLPDIGTLTATANGLSIGTSAYQIPCSPVHPSGIYDYRNVLAIFNNNVAARSVTVVAVYA